MSFLYRPGLERWHDWTDADHVWLLMSGLYVDDRDHDTIADIAAYETAVDGYARQPLSGALSAPFDLWYYGIAYGADRPSWSGMDAGGVAQWLVLAIDGPNDAASGLIGRWDFGLTDTGEDITINLAPWEDPSGASLPGGTLDTGLVHLRWSAA